MNYIKTIFLCCMVFIMSLVYASENMSDDEQSKIKIMVFVEQSEKDFVALQEKHASLWKHCIKTKEQYRAEGTLCTTYANPECTISEVEKLQKIREDLQYFKKNISNEIDKMQEEGININAIDNQGNSALNYSKSQVIYNALREKGAYFQIDAFTYMNRYILPLPTILLSLMAIGLYVSANIKPIEVETLKENKNINIVDEMGRTLLMNYLIKQEADLIELRKKDMSFIESQCKIEFNEDGSFANAIARVNLETYFADQIKFNQQLPLWLEYQDFLKKTRDTIKFMILQGVDLASKDILGNTVLNYCKTKIFYEDLMRYGAPFQYKVWLYFERDAFVIASVIILMTAGLIHIAGKFFEIPWDITNKTHDEWLETIVSRRKRNERLDLGIGSFADYHSYEFDKNRKSGVPY